MMARWTALLHLAAGVLLLATFCFFALWADAVDRTIYPPRQAASFNVVQPGGAPEGGDPLGGGNLFAALLPGEKTAKGSPVKDALRTAFKRGVDAQRAGQMDDAIAAYRDVLHLDPHATPARLNLAIIYQQMKRPEDALAQLQTGATYEPGNPVIALQTAQVLLDLKRKDAALAALRRASRLAPTDSPIHWQARSFAGQLLLSMGKPTEAYTEWAALARARPDDAQANFTAGALAVEALHRLPDGEAFLRCAWNQHPPDPRVALLFGRVLGTQKKLNEAQLVLQKAAVQFPDNIEIHGLLADIRWSRGDHPGAIATLRQIIARVPAARDNGVPLGRLRTVLAKQLATAGDVKGAVRELRAATALLPHDAEAQALLAEALVRSGAREDGAAALQKLLELDPKRDSARVMLARVLVDLGRPTEAQDQYDLFLKAHPKEVAVWAERAALYEKRENLPAALEVWNKVADLMPQNALPFLQRARILRLQNKPAAAMAAYSAALRIDPKNPGALMGAAQMANLIGHPSRAIEQLKTLIVLQPENDAAYDLLLETAGKAKTLDDALTFIRVQLGRNAERPAAYASILNYYREKGTPAEGEKFVADIIRRYPKAKAPRQALAVEAARKPFTPAPMPAPSPVLQPSPASAAPTPATTAPK